MTNPVPSTSGVERLMFRCPVCGCFKDSYDVETGTVFRYRMCWDQRAHRREEAGRLVAFGGSRRMRPVVVRVVQL